jgi:hypothetical protein
VRSLGSRRLRGQLRRGGHGGLVLAPPHSPAGGFREHVGRSVQPPSHNTRVPCGGGCRSRSQDIAELLQPDSDPSGLLPMAREQKRLTSPVPRTYELCDEPHAHRPSRTDAHNETQRCCRNRRRPTPCRSRQQPTLPPPRGPRGWGITPGCTRRLRVASCTLCCGPPGESGPGRRIRMCL